MANSLLTAAVTVQRPVFDAATAWGVAAIALVMAATWSVLLAQQRKAYGVGAALAFGAIVLATALGDAAGWFTRLDLLPPAFVVMNLLILVLVLLGFWGKPGQALARSLRWQTLVALQIFRLPLELLMLRAAYLQIMPFEFSMRGYNFDVLTGLGALLLILLAASKRSVPIALIWAWNLLGMACLAVITVLAVLTSPNVHAFGTAAQHINSWVLYFPYALLPSVLVSVALLGHLVLTRKLLGMSITQRSAQTPSIQGHHHA
jgi:hypothetical protein